MHRTHALLVLALLGLSQSAPADWSVALPEPRGLNAFATPATKFGAAVVIHYPSPAPRRLVWYSAKGEQLLDYTPGENGLDDNLTYILNEKQILLFNLAGPARTDIARLITLTGAGQFAIRDYVFTESQFPSLFLKYLIHSDLTGFYFTDRDVWTLSRIDFPPPPVAPGREITVLMQSSPAPLGPWKVLGEATLPASEPAEFLRLQAKLFPTQTAEEANPRSGAPRIANSPPAETIGAQR